MSLSEDVILYVTGSGDEKDPSRFMLGHIPMSPFEVLAYLGPEIAKYEKKLDALTGISNPTCHSGHNDYPLTLWDCPVCVQIVKRKLEEEIERLRLYLIEEVGIDHVPKELGGNLD